MHMYTHIHTHTHTEAETKTKMKKYIQCNAGQTKGLIQKALINWQGKDEQLFRKKMDFSLWDYKRPKSLIHLC